ncbi:hypothetical protein NL369_29555, partial [Klebsiella pneumoniae]|nr:hypothetical protein [Klebsiella pneumoniae]
ITAWRTERFASPQYADKYYQRKPFYQQALNEQTGALPSAAAPAESKGPREVPFIDKDRLDRAAWVMTLPIPVSWRCWARCC